MRRSKQEWSRKIKKKEKIFLNIIYQYENNDERYFFFIILMLNDERCIIDSLHGPEFFNVKAFCQLKLTGEWKKLME